MCGWRLGVVCAVAGVCVDFYPWASFLRQTPLPAQKICKFEVKCIRLGKKRLSDAKNLPRLVFALQKPVNTPIKKGPASPLISNDLMPVRFLEPRAAAVLGGREDYRLGIAVGDVPLAVVELLEIHLDVPVLAVVVVRGDVDCAINCDAKQAPDPASALKRS